MGLTLSLSSAITNFASLHSDYMQDGGHGFDQQVNAGQKIYGSQDISWNRLRVGAECS